MSNKNRHTQALDLLGDILEDTEELAREEEVRLAAELKRREEEAKREAEAERARRQADADRRMAEEETRRREAAERRSMAERAMQDVDAPVEEKPVVVAAPIPEPEKRSPVGALLAALVLGALAVGGFFGYQALTAEFVDRETIYTASAPAVQLLAANDASRQIAIRLKPEEEAAAPEAARRSSSSSRRSTTPTPAAPSGLRLGGGISGRN